MFRIFTVARNQLALVFRDGDLIRVLERGRHRLFYPFAKMSVTLINTTVAQADFPEHDALLTDPLLAPHLEVVDLRDGERALVWVDGRLQCLLEPGRHGFWKNAGSLRIERLAVGRDAFEHPDLEAVLALPNAAMQFEVIHCDNDKQTILYLNGLVQDVLGPGRFVFWKSAGKWQKQVCYKLDLFPATELLDQPKIREYLVPIDLCDGERALIWIDDCLSALLGPGRYGYWKSIGAIRIERLLPGPEPIAIKDVDTLLALQDAKYWLQVVEVGKGKNVVLTRDGEVEALLQPGRYVYWQGQGKLETQTVDLREQPLELNGQEIMTTDKVSLRLNLLVTYRIVDVLRAVQSVDEISQALYRQAQLALRALVGCRTLDALLTDKSALQEAVAEELKHWAAERGVDIVAAGVRDIILPGEMKTLMNQVTEAKKRAEAELIRRREETASARSQANTARLYAQNPTLMRLRELESVEAIMSQSQNTFVFSNGAVLDELTGKLIKPAE